MVALALGVPAWATAPKPALMIVGMPHLANPGRDIANTKVENILTPQRQREIEQLVDRLATFRPTHVAVEWPAGEQAKLDQRYDDYRAGRRTLDSNETDQIGLRLAAKLGLPRVDAVDWNDDAPGKDADYDFPAWLKAHGRGEEWTTYQATAQRQADAEGAFQRCHPLADWVRKFNDKAGLDEMARPYFEIATFGDDANNPGAAWVGAWYARNLRIYDHLLRIGGAPGQRTVAIFGAGHGPMLRSDAVESGRFTLADVVSYLPPLSEAAC
ncbi:DUF5694 domain-containing protein [Sphingomonas abietis]|uniref:DUF5694 domain-containing protein n=1 Tax=Sphingomonas abietis TaxID=3012344 RepID=A0ABY7NTU8_9SPHN|nr:DUF5694 domain-containing protein [Sphingomonas abietis]WBO22881.1 DUF5694 domain-containing protein [Sphingomonas abietis]